MMGKKQKSAAAIPVPEGPRMLRREIWVNLPDQQTYPGFRILVWSNHPMRLWNQVFTPTDTMEMAAALREIVREHNGWCDPDGAPFPPAESLEFYDVIPNELATQILLALIEWDRAGPLPNSLRPTKAESDSGSKRATKAGSVSPGSMSAGE